MFKKVCHFNCDFEATGAGWSDYNGYYIWDVGNGKFLVSMDNELYPPRPSGCDCNEFFLAEVKKQLEGQLELNPEGRTCLYGVINNIDRARKFFSVIAPRIRHESFGGSAYWFCIEVASDVGRIKAALPEIFNAKITCEDV